MVGSGEAGVGVGGAVPGDRFVRADVVVVVPVRVDLLDGRDPRGRSLLGTATGENRRIVTLQTFRRQPSKNGIEWKGDTLRLDPGGIASRALVARYRGSDRGVIPWIQINH